MTASVPRVTRLRRKDLPTIYIILGTVVAVLAGIWIWSPANLQQVPEENAPEIAAERAATEALVAEGRR